MVTFRLWQRLRHPPAQHPMFVRVTELGGDPLPWYIAFAMVLLAPIFFPIAIMLMSDLYSLIWAVNTSGAIAQEQERGTFDLLCMLPLGAFGTSWVFYTGYIHRHEMLHRLSGMGVWIFRIAFILLVIDLLSGSSKAFSIYQADNLPQLVYNVTLIAAVIAAVVLDHVQAIVISSLAAMLVPTYVKARFEVQFRTLLMVLLILVTTVMLAVGIGLGIYPPLGHVLGMPDQLVDTSALIVSLLAFGLVREGVITLLWRVMIERLNMDSADFDFATLYGV